MNAYPDWYKFAEVKFEMVKFLKNREVMFMKPRFSRREGKTTRMIRIHNVQSLDIWCKRLHISDDERDYNMYYSLAKYKDGIPFSSLILKERDFGHWNRDCWQEMESYDFLIDIDSGNHKEMDFAFYSAKVIKKLLDNLDVPYHLRFSGMGFHFIIPHRFFDNYIFNPFHDENIYSLYMSIAMRLHSKFSEMVDLNIYDYRRVTKIPYSLALYGDKTFICLPLNSDEEFYNFELRKMNPLFFIGKLRNREEKLFNENGKVYQLLKQLRIK